MSLFRILFVLAAFLFSGFALASGAVDINSADAATLQTLDGVGPSKAQAIVEYRKAHGPFKSVDELGEVKGIGDKTLEANRSKITVGGAAQAEPAKKKNTAKN